MNLNDSISFDLDPSVAQQLKSAARTQSIKLRPEALSEDQLRTCSGGKGFVACNSAFKFVACNSAFKFVACNAAFK
jgi:hypothetical protein